MKLAVISDIHSNLEALEAVLGDIRAAGAERILCLGDIIGYGADPEAVVTRVVQENMPSVAGNHELALAGHPCALGMTPTARSALALNRARLSGKSLGYLAELPAVLSFRGCRLVHGVPPDSSTDYLFMVPDSRLSLAMGSVAESVCFVGHTHRLGLVTLKKGALTRTDLEKKPVFLDTGCRYIINAGSVGQPRDGSRKATYVIWDTGETRVEARAVAYDNRRVALKMTEAGLPRELADRYL